jgi:hypothetical protein
MPANSGEKWSLSTGQRIARAFAKWMPWTFIGIILIFVYFGVANVVLLADDAKSTATLTAAELKDRIDELRWILELILAASGLFTIAQGIAAGFSAKSFSDQAEGMLAEIRGLFPVFQLLDERRKEANANLPNLDQAFTQISPAQSLGGRAYGNLSLNFRQRLLSADRNLPYEWLGRDSPPDVFAHNLRRLAQFYSAKFTYEWERGSGSLGDIEHALFLLSLATRKAGSKFYLLNDLGNIHVVYFKVLKSLPPPAPSSRGLELRDALNRARTCFEDSITAQFRQLRAYYNLAVIEADLAPAMAHEEPREDGLDLAIDHLRKGLHYREWEQAQNDEFTCNALYNLACYYARLSPRRRFAEGATLCVLRKAAKFGLIDPEYVRSDFASEKGDFYTLLKEGQPKTKSILNKVRSELSVRYRMAERQ